MEIIDISMTIEPDMSLYKNRNEKAPRFYKEKEFEKDGFMESSVKFNLHTGTHVDAPLHYLKNGEDVASLSPEKLIGLCRVIDFTKAEEYITDEDIVGMDFSGIDFVLFKTRNSIESRLVDFVYIDASAAEILKGKNLKGVGIDSLGIERNQEGHPTHKILLKEGVLIIEGLELKNVSSGEYLLIVLPLKIRSAEAAPARALLIKDFTEWTEMVYNKEKIER